MAFPNIKAIFSLGLGCVQAPPLSLRPPPRPGRSTGWKKGSTVLNHTSPLLQVRNHLDALDA